MSGMGMDPVAMSQGMYGGFGGPGMGMNGMNGGMGFDAGQNAYGGFNTQPQNQNSYGGHMSGNFGANAGFGGYNMPQQQGNFNQMHQHPNINHDFSHGHQNQGFQYRGRGRGRGNYMNAGRGRGFAPAYQGRPTNNDISQNQLPQQPVRRGSPVYTPMAGAEVDDIKTQPESKKEIENPPEDPSKQKDIEEQLRKEFAPGGADDEVQQNEAPVGAGETAGQDDPKHNDTRVEKDQVSETQSIDTEKPLPIPNVLSETGTEPAAASASKPPTPQVMAPPSAPAIPTGPASQRYDFSSVTNSRGRGFGRGFVRGASDYRSLPLGRGLQASTELATRPSSIPPEQSVSPPSEPKGLGVEGAPKAPKALRQGFPNTGMRPPQDTGFSIVGRASAAAQAHSNGHSKSNR